MYPRYLPPLFVDSGKVWSWHIFVGYFVAVLLERKSDTIRHTIFLRQGLGTVGFAPRVILMQVRLCSITNKPWDSYLFLPPLRSLLATCSREESRRVDKGLLVIVQHGHMWSLAILRVLSRHGGKNQKAKIPAFTFRSTPSGLFHAIILYCFLAPRDSRGWMCALAAD